MKITCAGGSSSVFKSALKAATESMCTSSMMYTRYLALAGVKFDSSIRARMLSTPLLLAASISTTSRIDPSSRPRQTGQTPHGSPSCGSRQLTALARIFAQVVLPVPREPVNRYACEIRPAISSFFSVTVTCGWPTTSAKSCGRYFLYSALYKRHPPFSAFINQKQGGRSWNM